MRVAQHTAKADAEITGQKQEVSEEGTKILYGYPRERPQGVPQEFKVFARFDKQARYLKGTMPEGPSWDKVCSGEPPKSSKQETSSSLEPMDPSSPLIDDMDIVTELWYSPTGEVAPSLPTAGAMTAATPASAQNQAAEPTLPSGGASSSSAAASAKRAGGEQEITRREIWEKTRDVTNKMSEKAYGLRRRNVKSQRQPSCFSSGV